MMHRLVMSMMMMMFAMIYRAMSLCNGEPGHCQQENNG
jgi:hypothetical protein